MKNLNKHLLLSIVIILFFAACHPVNKGNNRVNGAQADTHISYDDSTLANKVLPIMLPYNRVIDPAGKVIRFGDPRVENHSLDAKLIPQSTILAVEDRYGITLIDTVKSEVIAKWGYNDDKQFAGLMSTYSGLQVRKTADETQIFWSAANLGSHRSYVMEAGWVGQKLSIKNHFSFDPLAPSPLALPNELAIANENGADYLYVVLNGNNQLVKINLNSQKTVWTKPTGVAPYGIAIVDKQIFITNWGGQSPGKDTAGMQVAGIPYGSTYINPKTGATLLGSVQVISQNDGSLVKEIAVGLHPNAIIKSNDGNFVYVADANSDMVTVIAVATLKVTENIPVGLMAGAEGFIGDSPNALAISNDGATLYVANGLDNAVAVVKLGQDASSNGSGGSSIKGFIPTEAYPGGLLLDGNTLFVTNLEGEGPNINSTESKASAVPAGVTAYNAHHQRATISIIPVPGDQKLKQYTARVKDLNLTFREKIAQLTPRKDIAPKPMPERIGEPSVFQHVLYIIKENRTYDQVLGDMGQGNGMPALCTYGNSVTPNQHQIAKDFLLLDNYYASGKCSAEGHQWTDAAMVTEYVEKNVRAWFRSYPHVQEDALVYDANGFIWNDAADHGKTVRIYGEASKPNYDEKLTATEIYNNYKAGLPFKFYNTSTISRVRPVLSQNYPGADVIKISDQIRAEAYIKELKEYENKPGDELPQLMVMALSGDHTQGTRPGMPKPASMVADNDLALGRIIEALSKSRFWKNTVIFVTEDDSQDGWDHVSAYRTTGFVVSPYSRLQRTVSTNYNQTSIVRSIEQILGIPPMNIIDATALPMYNCFSDKLTADPYTALQNQIPLMDINPSLSSLKGMDLYFAKASALPEFDHVDGGRDDLMNRILWHAANGKKAYPARLAGKGVD